MESYKGQSPKHMQSLKGDGASCREHQFGLKGGTSGESKDHRWPHDLGKGLSPSRMIINWTTLIHRHCYSGISHWHHVISLAHCSWANLPQWSSCPTHLPSPTWAHRSNQVTWRKHPNTSALPLHLHNVRPFLTDLSSVPSYLLPISSTRGLWNLSPSISLYAHRWLWLHPKELHNYIQETRADTNPTSPVSLLRNFLAAPQLTFPGDLLFSLQCTLINEFNVLTAFS